MKRRNVNHPKVLFTLFILLLVLAACNNPLNNGRSDGSETADLRVSVSNGVQTQTLVPDLSDITAGIDRYRVFGTGPGGESFAPVVFDPGAAATVPDLRLGEWEITVEGGNSSAGTVLARAVVTVTVTEGGVDVEVDVTPLQEATGDISVDVAWPSGAGIDAVMVKLADAAPVDIFDASGSATFAESDVDSGSYLMRIRFMKDGDLEASILETVHVYDYVTTSASVEITEDDLKAPAAPSSLAASVADAATINLSWDASAVETETGFELQRDTSSDFPEPTNIPIDMNTESYSDTGLPSSTEFFYRIRARNPSSESTWSNTASAETAAVTYDVTIHVLDDLARPVSEANVLLGTTVQQTAAGGSTTFALESPNFTGDLAVYKGTEYEFRYIHDLTLDASGSPTYTVRLGYPDATNGGIDPTVEITGTIEPPPSESLFSLPSLEIWILDSAGAREYKDVFLYDTNPDTDAFEYIVETRIDSSDAVLFIDYESATDVLNGTYTRYYSGIDLSGGTTINISPPDPAELREITVTNDSSETGTGVGTLVVPGYGSVLGVATTGPLEPSEQATVTIHDPDERGLRWAFASPWEIPEPGGEPITYLRSTAAQTTASATVTLPSPPSGSAPDGGVDMTQASFDASGDTLSLPAVSGADTYAIALSTFTAGEVPVYGVVYSAAAVIEFHSDFADTILQASGIGSWSAGGAAVSGLTPAAFAEKQLSMPAERLLRQYTTDGVHPFEAFVPGETVHVIQDTNAFIDDLLASDGGA